MRTLMIASGRAMRLSVGAKSLGTLSVPGTYRLGDGVSVAPVQGQVIVPDADGTIAAYLAAGESDLIRAVEDLAGPLYAWYAAGCPIPVPASMMPPTPPAILLKKFAVRSALRAAKLLTDPAAKLAAVRAAVND